MSDPSITFRKDYYLPGATATTASVTPTSPPGHTTRRIQHRRSVLPRPHSYIHSIIRCVLSYVRLLCCQIPSTRRAITLIPVLVLVLVTHSTGCRFRRKAVKLRQSHSLTHFILLDLWRISLSTGRVTQCACCYKANSSSSRLSNPDSFYLAPGLT